ncbi:MAG: MFS transporter [Candidatus Nitrosopolaris sp.]
MHRSSDVETVTTRAEISLQGDDDLKNSANAGSSSHHRWLALIIVLMAPFMATVDFYIIFVASPSIQHGLQASPEQIQFAIAGYTIAYGVNLITAGRLGDTYGRKRMFVIGMISFIITSALCAFAQDPLTLIITRVFQGTAVSTSTLYNSSYLHRLWLYTVLLLVLLRLQDKSLVAFFSKQIYLILIGD